MTFNEKDEMSDALVAQLKWNVDVKRRVLARTMGKLAGHAERGDVLDAKELFQWINDQGMELQAQYEAGMAV